MREGILMSAGLHVGIVAVAITGLPQLLDLDPPLESPIVIDVVTVDESQIEKPEPKMEPMESARKPPPARAETPKPPPAAGPAPSPPQLASLQPESAPILVPEPDTVEPVPEAPPPKPVTAKPPPPPVAPKAKPETAVEPKPETPKPKKPARRVAPPRRKPETPPDTFETLLRNLDKQRRQHAKVVAKAAKERKEAPQLRRSDRPKRRAESRVERQRVVAALVRNIQTQVRRCWNPPTGAKDAREIRVRIRIRLNPDGTLIGRPSIVDRDRVNRDPAFQVFAESAIRALRNPRCSPLRLPLVSYETWREISFDFELTELLQ